MLDVDRWLDTVEPQAFDKWVAFRQLEPDPLDRIAEILKLGFAAVVNAWGVDLRPEYFDPSADKNETAKTVSPKEGAKIIARAYSVKKLS